MSSAKDIACAAPGFAASMARMQASPGLQAVLDSMARMQASPGLQAVLDSMARMQASPGLQAVLDSMARMQASPGLQAALETYLGMPVVSHWKASTGLADALAGPSWTTSVASVTDALTQPESLDTPNAPLSGDDAAKSALSEATTGAASETNLSSLDREQARLAVGWYFYLLSLLLVLQFVIGHIDNSAISLFATMTGLCAHRLSWLVKEAAGLTFDQLFPPDISA